MRRGEKNRMRMGEKNRMRGKSRRTKIQNSEEKNKYFILYKFNCCKNLKFAVG